MTRERAIEKAIKDHLEERGWRPMDPSSGWTVNYNAGLNIPELAEYLDAELDRILADVAAREVARG